MQSFRTSILSLCGSQGALLWMLDGDLQYEILGDFKHFGVHSVGLKDQG